MWKLILLLFSTSVLAGEYRLLEADNVYIEGSKIHALRYPYIPEYSTGTDGESWRYGIAAGFDLCLFCYKKYDMFWRNQVHGRGTNYQVRHVGWFWELGMTIVPEKVEVFHRHHSQHCLECEPQDSGFPLLDEYVVRFNIFKRK